MMDDSKQPESLAARSALLSRKRSRILFSGSGNARSILVPSIDPALHKSSIARRIRLNNYPLLSNAASVTLATTGEDHVKKKNSSGKGLTSRVIEELREENLKKLQNGGDESLEGVQGQQIILRTEGDTNNSSNTNEKSDPLALQVATYDDTKAESSSGAAPSSTGGILVKKESRFTNISVPTPVWHAPWQLTTVISSHLGWVRSIAFDPTNDMFATGAADRTIKIFDFAKACVGADDSLKITLTGHISPIRGMAFSPKHPYLFSAGEDKMVKCWDLETNQVVRHYHGHLSGVFDLKLHPTLDVLVTGGRDAVARVWDMRTKHQIHCLTGHDNTVGAILTKGTDPQVITGSYDSTVKLWDLTAGKCMTTLTHHKKSVRAIAQPSFENTFISGAADTLKKWVGSDGRFIKNFSGHNAVINALAVNDDGVAMSGGDDGTMNFWDYKTGYCFQKTTTIAQPGSLDAENGIFAAEFDLTGTRLITGEADKTIKIWKQNDEASKISYPIDMKGWKKKCLAEAKQRY